MTDQPTESLTRDQFGAHFRGAAPALWCVAAAVLGRRDGAEDAVQDAAIQALGKLETFRAGTDFTAWMAKIVRYTALNQMRRTQRSPRPIGDQLDETLAPSPRPVAVSQHGHVLPEQTEFDDRVVQGLEGLSEVQRTCLLLRTILDLSYREIGDSLEMPEGTAMSHVHRARQQLAVLFRDDGAQGTMRKTP